MTVRPTFQAQNPAISGYSLGWSSCTAFAAAMVASFDAQVPKLVTGKQVRVVTHDTIGGLTLAQVDAALQEWDVNLDTIYRLPWASFAKRIDAGEAAILQGWYAPIADSRFDAGRGFRRNHAIPVPPAWGALDPLADGRYGEAYKYKGEAYPQALLRDFAGKLNLSTSGYSALGAGLVYASFSGDRVANWHAAVPKGDFGLYVVDQATRTVKLSPKPRRALTGGFQADCTPPALYRWFGHTSQRLVVLTSGGLAAKGRSLGLTYAIRDLWAKEV